MPEKLFKTAWEDFVHCCNYFGSSCFLSWKGISVQLTSVLRITLLLFYKREKGQVKFIILIQRKNLGYNIVLLL